MIFSFEDYIPVIHESSFIHPLAAVTGDVIIGKNCYIGPGAALRGDWGTIIIEDGCNVQENCTVHMFPGITVLLKEGSHIGHGAVIHGAITGRNSLVGMNSVIMDNVELGDECIVGALSLIREGEKFPPRSLIAGSPARIIRQVTDEMLAWKTEGTKLYQQLPSQLRSSWKEVDPLRERPSTENKRPRSYLSWKNNQQQE